RLARRRRRGRSRSGRRNGWIRVRRRIRPGRGAGAGARRALGATHLAAVVLAEDPDARAVGAQLAPVVEGGAIAVVAGRDHPAVARIGHRRRRDLTTHLAAPVRPDEADARAVGAQLAAGALEGVLHVDGGVAESGEGWQGEAAAAGSGARSRRRAGVGGWRSQSAFDNGGGVRVSTPAMYDTSDIRKGLKVLMDGQPYTVIEFQFVKPGKGAAFTRTKFKNLLTGSVIEKNIRSGEKLEPANVEEREMQFLYKEGDDFVFMDGTTYEQTTVAADIIGDQHDLMMDNMTCTVLFFNERAVDVSLPNFIEVVVTETEPGARGDTAGNVTKPARIETGAEIAVPLFINQGDT